MKALAQGPGRYSPHPIKHYGADIFKILVQDKDAWNLAYLSWDWEERGAIQDPYFSTHIVRTLQCQVGAGQILRACLNNIPPRAAYLIRSLPGVSATPLVLAYSKTWLETLDQRARQWRAPHHPTLDAPVNDFTSALEVIRKL